MAHFSPFRVKNFLPIFGGTMLRPDSSAIIGDLEAWYDASDPANFTLDGSNRVSRWKDVSGNSPAGERDLVQATEANRPIYLPWSGTNYGYLNGVSGACFSTPDSAATSPAGDFFVAVKAALVDWTPSARQLLVSKYNATGNQRSWWLSVETDGKIALNTSIDGTNVVNCVSSVAPTITNGAPKWIGAFFDADNGASGRDVTLYTSDDNVTWTQLGTTVITATASGLFDSTASLIFGANDAGAANLATGNFFYGYMSTTVGGTPTVLFDPNASYTSGSTLTASTGEVWTVNGGAHIVTRTGLYFDGSNGYLKSAAFTLVQPTTGYVVAQSVTWTAGDTFFDGDTLSSFRLAQGGGVSPYIAVNCGTLAAGNASLVLKTAGVVTVVGNGASSLSRVNRIATVSGNCGTGSAGGLTLGSAGDASLFGNIFVSELAVFSAAHDVTTQERLALYAGRKWRFNV